ncbi:MAG: dTMP kinase [Thermoplasmata archaeon]
MKGFVVIEGIDGCGKSSVARRVAARLGRDVILTREPTNSWLGKAVRRGDASDVSPFADALLFMADRALHTHDICRLIVDGWLVISDRYYHSTVAYQAANLKRVFKGDVFAWLLESNRRISLTPDLTVLLTVPAEVGLRRVSSRGTYSRFEKLAFLEEVARNYERLAVVDRSVVKVDATKSLDEVAEEVLSLIRAKLGKRR